MASKEKDNATSACHRALALPDIVLSIFDHLPPTCLLQAAEAGGPFLRTIKGSHKLSQDLCLQYTDDITGDFQHNTRLFDWTLPCHNEPMADCGNHKYKGVRYYMWDHGSMLPHMELHYPCEAIGPAPIEIRMEAYDDIVQALESGDLFLQMLPGRRREVIKLVIKNGSWKTRQLNRWQGPPNALSWTTAELLVLSTEMGMILRIAKKLIECADAINAKVFRGELSTWDEETGKIANSQWEDYFDAEELAVIQSDQPKYRWFWNEFKAKAVDAGCLFIDHCRGELRYNPIVERLGYD